MSLELLTKLLDLPHVYVIGYEMPNDEKLIVDIEVRMPAATCPACEHVSTKVHSYGEKRTVRDLDVWGRQCYLRFQPREFECTHCKRFFVERLAWLESGQHQTRRVEMRVFELARRTNVAESAAYHALTDECAEGIFGREAARRVEARGCPTVKVLHADEIAPHKGHGNYCLVLSAPGVGVLDVLEDRLEKTFEAWLDARGQEWCAAVEEFHADMWKPYHEVARAKLPNVHLTTADHFHVIENLNKALGEVRKTIQRQADEDTRQQLKGSRWLLVKNQADLPASDQVRLETILRASPELKINYELKEDFRAIYALTDREQAAEQLSDWLDKARAQGHHAMQTFVTTVENWHDEILNFFDGRGSNGFAEGVNNKIKLVLRRAFGCPNFAHFRLRILVAFDP
jgi:transposase